jgi:hypothetical protein
MAGRLPGSEFIDRTEDEIRGRPASGRPFSLVGGSELGLQPDAEDQDRAISAGRGLQDDL